MVEKLKLFYNSISLAGTGYGKSLIFEAVAALGGKKKVTLVICPLKALEDDQVKQAWEKGLKVVLINADNMKDDHFEKLWTDAKFHSHAQALIVDKVRFINEWGQEFCPMYKQLHQLRNFTGQEHFRGCKTGVLGGFLIRLLSHAGMGHNVLNVNYSIVFECLKSLSILVQRWGHVGCNQTVPPEVGVTVQHVCGQGKVLLKPQSHTTLCEKLEKNLEVFINSATSSSADMLFQPETRLDIYHNPTDKFTSLCRPVSQNLLYELSWTILNLKHSPPAN
ncbi:hypothetical protein C8R44DRAFT_741242 [Mycena epipterygia]|nr:hypothetical protein C8R44DRAFT_741242 [Mycena epipterygia]